VLAKSVAAPRPRVRQTALGPLGPHLPVAVDYIFIGCQFPQAARAAGMEFVRADADLGAEAEFAPVIEPRAGVDHDRRAVDAGCELPGGGEIGRHDRFGVLRAVVIDVLDGGVERGDNLHRQHRAPDIR